jgi:hypothetical protein
LKKLDFETAAVRYDLVPDQPDGAHAAIIPPIGREEKLPDNGR